MASTHGYVAIAPACGDCHHSDSADERGLFCKRNQMPVADGGRCILWMPSVEWMRANPVVQRLHRPKSICNVQGLSPEEQAYSNSLHNVHPLH